MGLVGACYLGWQKHRQNKLATKLLREVSAILQPATSGLSSEKAFDIHYREAVLQKIKGRLVVLTESAAMQYARQINAAWKGWWLGGDDENAVYAVFKALKDKVQVSQVAKAYYTAYHIDLADKIHDRMDEKEIGIVLEIIKRLPAYRTN